MLSSAAGYGHVLRALWVKLGFAQTIMYVPGIYMGWGLGANDSANIFGPAVTSRAIRYRTAVILTAIFVIIGSCVQGPGVMPLFSKVSGVDALSAILSAGAAALTMHIMTHIGIPASTSQAIMGSVIGVGLYFGTANFEPLIKVVICWIATPIGGFFIAMLLYVLFRYLLNRYAVNIAKFEEFIAWAILLSGCYGAYALGANNVANVTGVYYAAGLLNAHEAALLGGIAIAVGALTYSYRVMFAVGVEITELDRFSAFIAIFSVALTVHTFAFVGVPVSTSQAIVGAVAGIGIAKGMGTVNTKKLRDIFIGWLSTPFISGLVSYIMILVATLIRNAF